MSHGLRNASLEAFRDDYERDPEGFKQRALAVLVPDAIHGTALAAAGRAPFDRPQRWACRLAFEIAKWVGAESQVSIAFVLADKLGCDSLEDAQRLLGIAREAEDADIGQLRQQWLAVGRALMADPSFRETSREVLYGELAEVVESKRLNGKSKNGNGRHP